MKQEDKINLTLFLLVFITFLLVLSACGNQELTITQKGCYISQIESGVIITCGNGTTAAVLNGATGQKGNQGDIGEKGEQGIQGISGTSVSIVQFCPGYSSSSFPEVGFCINDKLYAEWFQIPSSGLVYIPPGNYSSTITNAPCNFKVVSGCQIQ